MSITHEFVNPKADSADTTITRPSDWNAAHLGNGIDWYNVKDHGAVGDNATDDTAALQAAFALLDTTVYDLYIPPGTYRITDTLDIPFTQYRRIFGAGMGATIIKMMTANTPIIRVTVENTHTNSIEDMMLMFSTPQPKTNTLAQGILFTVAGGTGAGFYEWGLRRLIIDGTATGIGLGGSGSVSLWAATFDTIIFTKTSGSAINLVSPVAIGMPVNRFQSIRVRNTGSGITGMDPAIRLSAVEMDCAGLDIEDWIGTAIYSTGGNPVTIRQLHIERHVLNTANPRILDLANGPVMIDGASIQGSSTSAMTKGSVFYQDGGSLNARGVGLEWTPVGSGYLQVFGGANNSKIWANDTTYTVSAQIGEYLGSGFGNDLYTRVLIDGLPPAVDVLPTASVTYRGRRFRVLGGAGVADVVSECSKDAANAYNWVTK